MTTVYFARPIDLAGNISYLGTLIAEIEQILVNHNVSYFKPHNAYTVNMQDPASIDYVDRINTFALYGADAIVAVLPREVATLGVPAEIERALQFNKPTVIVTDILYSIQLAAWEKSGATVIRLADDLSALDQWDVKGSLTKVPDPDERDDLGDTLLVRYDDPAKPTLARGKYEGDAGIDLAISVDVTIPAGHLARVSTGAHVAIPDGYFGLITGRSSTTVRWNCTVVQAVIDSGYRGELLVQVRNDSNISIQFQAGMRLAQMILLPVWSGDMRQTEELPGSERSTNGFGSSGH